MNASYAMNLGGTVVRFDCDPARLAPVLEWWFDRPSATAAPHLAVALSLVPHPDRLDIPNTLLRTKTLDGTGGFDIHDGLFSGRLDRAAGRAVVRAKAALAQGQLKRVLEQIMYQAYYSARDLAGKQDVLLHSSAVIADGRGFLFVGPSEAGKSTAVVNSAQYHVLGDEMTLVRRTADGFVIEGTPFNGSFREKAPGQAPLTAVFLLARAPHHRVCDMEPGEATAAIAAEVVPMVGLDQVPGADTVPAMVETAAALVESVPVHRLELLPDPGFWREINRVFGLDRTRKTRKRRDMLELNAVLAPNEKCPVREIGDGLVIMAAEGETTHSLDEIGSFIWSLLDGQLDLAAVLDVILDEYEVTEDVAKPDLIEFASQMLEAGLLVKVD